MNGKYVTSVTRRQYIGLRDFASDVRSTRNYGYTS